MKLWEKIKKWFILTALPWIKKGWIQIVNVIIIFIAYGALDNVGKEGIAGLVGLWLFVLIAYWVFWKLLGAEKAFKGKK